MTEQKPEAEQQSVRRQAAKSLRNGPPSPAKNWLFLVGNLAMLTLFVFDLPAIIADGLERNPTVVLGVIFACNALVALALLFRPRQGNGHNLRTLQLRRDGASTLIPYTRFGRIVAYFWILGIVTMSVLVPIAANAIPPHETGRWVAAFKLLALVSPAVVVVGIAFLGNRLIRKRGELGVGLSPNGLYHWWILGCCFYPWKSIAKLSPETSYGSPTVRLIPDRPWMSSDDPEENRFSKKLWYRRSLASINPRSFAIESTLVTRALLFYHQHPELREELGTDVAVERIRSGNFAN